MMIKIPICPECKKELSLNSTHCHHCSKSISDIKFRSVFSWSWIERISLLFLVLMLVSFFMPWFPGKFLSQENPLSPLSMLLHMVDLEVEFLDSYDVLRMILIVPLFSLVLFLMVYLGDKLKTTPFPGIFLIVCILVSIFIFIFQTLSGFFQWGAAAIFLGGFLYYLQNCYKKGTLGRISYYLLTIFMLISIFLYLFDLSKSFYANLDPLLLAETFGFFMTWALSGLLVLFAILYNIRSVEDFWIVLFALCFSLIAYSTMVQPFFVSGPLKFFADNLNETFIHLIAHIRIVGIALIIAIVTGIPLGVYITRHPGAAGIVLYISSILITIPSIAMFGFMMPILSSLDNAWDAVSGIGIGVVPAIVALALYSLLPIIRNTYIALKNVDPATIEAGKGMGLTNFQLLIQLQIPLSAPIIMAGVRTAVVMGIAIAAIAAYIGAGGLGLFVSQGLAMSTNNSVIAGAIAMSCLAIVADIFLAKVEEWVTPTGLKVKQATE
ncbi:MAG: ABC transporter permease subunit [Desulfobacterales bacterium]|nr:ABC transporter permease subunit [Desulfobacterales bacterium]